jgi:hypothetical protein
VLALIQRERIYHEQSTFFVGSLKDLLTNEKRETTQSASHKLGEGGVLEEAHLGVLRPAVHVVA